MARAGLGQGWGQLRGSSCSEPAKNLMATLRVSTPRSSRTCTGRAAEGGPANRVCTRATVEEGVCTGVVTGEGYMYTRGGHVQGGYLYSEARLELRTQVGVGGRVKRVQVRGTTPGGAAPAPCSRSVWGAGPTMHMYTYIIWGPRPVYWGML